METSSVTGVRSVTQWERSGRIQKKKNWIVCEWLINELEWLWIRITHIGASISVPISWYCSPFLSWFLLNFCFLKWTKAWPKVSWKMTWILKKIMHSFSSFLYYTRRPCGTAALQTLHILPRHRKTVPIETLIPTHRWLYLQEDRRSA